MSRSITSHHVSLESDLTVGITSHQFISTVPPLPTPVLGYYFTIEYLAYHGWLPGKWTGLVKLTKTVKHKKQAIVQKYHNCSPMLFHITLPIFHLNIRYPIMMINSKRQIKFSASTVRGNIPPLGVSTLVIPMLSCAEPFSLPTSLGITSYLNSVMIGLTLGDWLYGLITIAATMALDAYFNKFKWKKFKDKWGDNAVLSAGEEDVYKVFRDQWFSIGNLLNETAFKKGVLLSLTDFAASFLTDDPTFSFWIGHSLKYSFGIKGRTRKDIVQIGWYVGGKKSPIQGKEEISWSPEKGRNESFKESGSIKYKNVHDQIKSFYDTAKHDFYVKKVLNML